MTVQPDTIPIRPAPACPPGVPDEVRAAFERFAAMLGHRAAAIDAVPLLMLAQSWHTWQQATNAINQLGNVVMSGGTAVPNPSLAIAHRAHGQILALLKELQLSPAARAKLDIEGFEDNE